MRSLNQGFSITFDRFQIVLFKALFKLINTRSDFGFILFREFVSNSPIDFSVL